MQRIRDDVCDRWSISARASSFHVCWNRRFGQGAWIDVIHDGNMGHFGSSNNGKGISLFQTHWSVFGYLSKKEASDHYESEASFWLNLADLLSSFYMLPGGSESDLDPLIPLVTRHTGFEVRCYWQVSPSITPPRISGCGGFQSLQRRPYCRIPQKRYVGSRITRRRFSWNPIV